MRGIIKFAANQSVFYTFLFLNLNRNYELNGTPNAHNHLWGNEFNREGKIDIMFKNCLMVENTSLRKYNDTEQLLTCVL